MPQSIRAILTIIVISWVAMFISFRIPFIKRIIMPGS